MKDHLSAFTPAELRKLRSFKDPYGIQRFLDDTAYHLADTAWSPRRVLREQTSHCLEGAIFAAAALRALGFPPLIVDFEAENDTDHVLGSSRSKDTGERLPRRTIRDAVTASQFIDRCANWR